jgi:hypothetical protein
VPTVTPLPKYPDIRIMVISGDPIHGVGGRAGDALLAAGHFNDACHAAVAETREQVEALVSIYERPVTEGDFNWATMKHYLPGEEVVPVTTKEARNGRCKQT